jgi:hypothetical protein
MAQDSYVSILPGELEGAYAWLSVQLILKRAKDDTAAIFDMGGSSTQFAFVPPQVPLSNYVPLEVGRLTYVIIFLARLLSHHLSVSPNIGTICTRTRICTTGRTGPLTVIATHS